MPTTQILCYNCFRPVEDPAALCPHCGFDLAENRQKFPVALPAGTVLNGRYIVGRVLGQGGFGITYVAFDTQLQAKVAVKEYMPGEMATRTGTTVSVMMDTKAEDFTYGAERFQEEARTLAKFMGHPNIAGVSSYFDENGTSYFVMDYIEGVSFKNYIANNGGKVSVDETLNVMIPVLRALTAVHAEGFIHRDVTPDNIYISKDGNVKLLDFGSARYSIGDKSKSLDVILKVGYAPKEQYIRRGRQGPYTDVYSCAACFYAALTGFLPPESLDRLEEDTLVPVSRSVPDIPEWLDRAILKGLAVQPEDRFQSAAEFLNAIENQIPVEVPAAAAPAPAQPERKKPKAILIAGIAAVLAVCVGLGVFLGGRGREAAPPPAAPAEEEPASQQPETPPEPQPEPEPQLRQAPVPSITIQGVEYSTDLTELDLTGAPERLTQEDVNALGNMVNLRNLRIIVDPWTRDLSPLANLTELKDLAVQAMYRDYTEWQDPPETPALTGLETLTELTGFTISEIPLLQEDLETLGHMTALTSLAFNLAPKAGGVAYDLSPLSSLTELSCLYINDSSVPEERITLVSLEPLRALTGLRELAVAGLRDLSPLAELTGLGSLTLTVSEGIDLTPLSALVNLRELWISSHYGTVSLDLSPLRELTKLNSAEFFNIHADDWSPVEHVPGLSRENCD